MNAENNFSRAEFFKPVDWGSNLQTLASKEPQVLKFNAACNNHPRHAPQAQPADWAEAFTHSDAMQRWPAPATHVIDWNQFWKTKDKGLQISIRWNFELPARYSVLGYSFAADKPDGYGAPLFPEKSDLTWDDAKAFVLELEKKIVADGGTPTTRTMSVAEKAFNPGEVSPDEIQRAEFTNSRVRGAQTGKMSCNANSAELTTLSCACWF